MSNSYGIERSFECEHWLAWGYLCRVPSGPAMKRRSIGLTGVCPVFGDRGGQHAIDAWVVVPSKRWPATFANVVWLHWTRSTVCACHGGIVDGYDARF